MTAYLMGTTTCPQCDADAEIVTDTVLHETVITHGDHTTPTDYDPGDDLLDPDLEREP